MECNKRCNLFVDLAKVIYAGLFTSIKLRHNKMTINNKKGGIIMIKIVPERIQKGDEIRIISPSSSLERVGGFEENLISKTRIEKLGFKVSFSENINKNDSFFSSSIDERVNDFHKAFSDPNVKAVLTTIGGYNSNELLPYIDWEIVKNNPKIFIGYSDITSLHNAIRAKTGLVTYYGPCYSGFKMDELQDYQSKDLVKAITQNAYSLVGSPYWSSDPWFDKTISRALILSKWKVYNHGNATSTITGGNIQTYYLQAGTSYFPEVKNPVVFLEQAEEGLALEFSRELAQVLQIHPDIKGLVLGRFPKENELNNELLPIILDKFPILKTIPVIFDLDFGHTQPIFTFPLGGEVKLETENLNLSIING